jgi:hypothetical protein
VKPATDPRTACFQARREPGLKTRKTREPRLRHPGLSLVRRGAFSRLPGDNGSAAQPRLRLMLPRRSPCTTTWRPAAVQGDPHCRSRFRFCQVGK